MACPMFTLRGTFLGTTILAAKWLKKFDRKMEDYCGKHGRFSPGKYLDSLSMLLIDKASA